MWEQYRDSAGTLVDCNFATGEVSFAYKAWPKWSKKKCYKTGARAWLDLTMDSGFNSVVEIYATGNPAITTNQSYLVAHITTTVTTPQAVSSTSMADQTTTEIVDLYDAVDIGAKPLKRRVPLEFRLKGSTWEFSTCDMNMVTLRDVANAPYVNTSVALWALAGYEPNALSFMQGRIYIYGVPWLITRAASEAPKHPPGVCPQCGDEGKFIRMALCCNEHGVFGGM